LSRVVTFQGGLEPYRFLWVLRHIFLDRSRGTLHLERPGEEIHLLFNEGELTTARSTREGQRLGERLIRRGLISREELEQALDSRASHPNERIGSAMVRLRLLSRAVLFEELTVHVREITFEAFGWTSANYFFEPSSDPIDADVELGLSTAAIIVEAIRRMTPDDRFIEALGDDTRLLVVSDDPFSRYDVLSLRPEEAYVLSLCDGRTSLRDVLRAAGPARLESARTLFALMSCGLLDLAPAPAAPAVRRTDPPIRPEERPAPGYPPEIDLQRRQIEQLTRKVDFLSSRELLGLPEGPLAQEQIDEAFQARSREFHPDLRKRPEFSDLGHELEVLYVAVAQAHRRLLQEERAVQVARAAEAAKVTPVPEEPVADPALRANMARENYKAAKKKLENGDPYGAILLLEESVRVVPNSAEYHFWLGRALARNPKWKARALKHFESAITISPQRTDVAYEMAGILLSLGHPEQAREIAHALVQRHPDNSRFLEFAQECDQSRASAPTSADTREAIANSLWRRLFSRG
jgi:TolA-binding protein